MNWLNRINKTAGRALDWFAENLLGWFLGGLVLGMFWVVVTSVTARPTELEFTTECRATCSSLRLKFVGVEFGSKRQCRCEVSP